jgi:hypothetical protein
MRTLDVHARHDTATSTADVVVVHSIQVKSHNQAFSVCIYLVEWKRAVAITDIPRSIDTRYTHDKDRGNLALPWINGGRERQPR